MTTNGNVVSDFLVFLEIEVGGKTKDELLAEFDANGMFASDYAKDIMSNDAWKSGERKTVKFGRATIRELGFTENPTTQQIWVRIVELGHALCESGDGPAIRLALKDQPRGDWFWVAMEQIAASGGFQRVFGVGCDDDGRSWLSADWFRPGSEWRLVREVVFRLRK